MPNITLPTEAERANVDTNSFTWSNSEPGNLTKPHGALVKLICDQLDAGEYVQVISQGRGTGKTPKFIVENCTNGANLKIVMRDNFAENKGATTSEENKTGPYETFINATSKANVKVLLGSIDNVYLQDLDGCVSESSDTWTYTNTETSTEIASLDRSGACTPFNSMTTEDINTEVGQILADWHTREVILNKDDDKLDGGGARVENYDVQLVCPAPFMQGSYLKPGGTADEQANLDAWLQRDFTLGFLRVWNKVPVGGVAIYDKVHLPKINSAILDAVAHLDAATYDSCLYNNTEADYTGAYQSFAIKKLA
tara:strand:- start:879 stop:1811 length:933 start_codon:yes stop_codon:yes gene_type:complete